VGEKRKHGKVSKSVHRKNTEGGVSTSEKGTGCMEKRARLKKGVGRLVARSLRKGGAEKANVRKGQPP